MACIVRSMCEALTEGSTAWAFKEKDEYVIKRSLRYVLMQNQTAALAESLATSQAHGSSNPAQENHLVIVL